jgi:hypothetical protein
MCNPITNNFGKQFLVTIVYSQAGSTVNNFGFKKSSDFEKFLKICYQKIFENESKYLLKLLIIISDNSS